MRRLALMCEFVHELVLHVRDFHLGLTQKRADELSCQWAGNSSYTRDGTHKSFGRDRSQSLCNGGHHLSSFFDEATNFSQGEHISFIFHLKMTVVTDLVLELKLVLVSHFLLGLTEDSSQEAI